MRDYELEEACSEIEDLADRVKQLLQDVCAEEEIHSIMVTIDEANVRLKQLISEKLAQKRGQRSP